MGGGWGWQDGPGQRRGATSLSFSHSPTSLRVCVLFKGLRVPEEPAGHRGPPAQVGKSVRHPLAPRGLPGSGTPRHPPTPRGSGDRRMDQSIFVCGHPLRYIHPSPGLCPAGGRGLCRFLGEASGPGVAPALFSQQGARSRTLTVHPGEEKQDQRRPPPRRLFCAPATGHNHGRWSEREGDEGGGGGGGGGAGARRRRHRAPGCSLRSPRRREGEGPPPPPARAPSLFLPPSGPPLSSSPAPTRGGARVLHGTALPGAGVASASTR